MDAESNLFEINSVEFAHKQGFQVRRGILLRRCKVLSSVAILVKVCL